MNKQQLKELIENGENSSVEFTLDTTSAIELAKEIVAFANFQGGVILLGVDDNGEIQGIKKEKCESWVMDICQNNVYPQVIPFYEQIKISDNKIIAVVKIEQGEDKPYSVNKRHYYLRMGSHSSPASKEQIRRLFQGSGLYHFDMSPVPMSKPDDLDLKKIKEYFSEKRNMPLPEDKEELFNILYNATVLTKIEDEYVCTVGGLLLFGKNPSEYLFQNGIDFVHFKGAEINSEFLDRKSFSKTIVENIEDLIDVIKTNTLHPSYIKFLKRIEEQPYPEKILREAIVNAVAHRDYIINSKIRIFLFEDRLEIKSPGSPPNTVTVKNMLSGVVSIVRNPLLFKVLRDYMYIEGVGTGVRMIFNEMQKKSGKTPKISIDNEQVELSLYI